MKGQAREVKEGSGADFAVEDGVSNEGRVRIGTSGYIYPHWRRTFYPRDLPESDWLAFYSRSFDTVKINYTFYRLPAAEVFTAWRRQAPSGFVYAVKASRFLTHMKMLKDPAQPLKAGMTWNSFADGPRRSASSGLPIAMCTPTLITMRTPMP